MIEDLELRTLFKVESGEHLQTLENGLLRLEANPTDTAVIEDLFRSAHSLKGAARMLGVADLETLAHHFEDQLNAARRGSRPITAEGADRLYQGLDAMRQLALEAGTGANVTLDLSEVLARLRGDAIPEQATKVSRQGEIVVALPQESPNLLPQDNSAEPRSSVSPDAMILPKTDEVPTVDTIGSPIVIEGNATLATTFKIETSPPRARFVLCPPSKNSESCGNCGIGTPLDPTLSFLGTVFRSDPFLFMIANPSV